MFSVLRYLINPSQKLNNDLDKVSIWANKLKMSFNPDPSQQAQEEHFSRKIRKVYHPLLPLIIFPFNKYHIKNIYRYILMKSLHSNIILMKR